MKTLQLVKEAKYGRVGILGEKTTVTPCWLFMQEIPFDDNAVFIELYPITGGAMVVDKNKLEYLGTPSKEELKQVLGEGKYGYNPAAETIKKMMEK